MHDQELEFTIEPFVEGQPGPHVRAAVEAVEALGVPVEFGPFGSSCRAAATTMPSVVAAIVQEAFGNGASHVSMHVAVGALGSTREPAAGRTAPSVAPSTSAQGDAAG